MTKEDSAKTGEFAAPTAARKRGDAAEAPADQWIDARKPRIKVGDATSSVMPLEDLTLRRETQNLLGAGVGQLAEGADDEDEDLAEQEAGSRTGGMRLIPFVAVPLVGLVGMVLAYPAISGYIRTSSRPDQTAAQRVEASGIETESSVRPAVDSEVDLGDTDGVAEHEAPADADQASLDLDEDFPDGGAVAMNESQPTEAAAVEDIDVAAPAMDADGVRIALNAESDMAVEPGQPAAADEVKPEFPENDTIGALKWSTAEKAAGVEPVQKSVDQASAEPAVAKGAVVEPVAVDKGREAAKRETETLVAERKAPAAPPKSEEDSSEHKVQVASAAAGNSAAPAEVLGSLKSSKSRDLDRAVPEKATQKLQENIPPKAPEKAANTAGQPVAAPEKPDAGTPMGAITTVPAGWYVQLIAERELSKAQDLSQKVRQAGFAAVIQSAPVNGTTFYRVLVGPKTSSAAAGTLKGEVQKAMKLREVPFLKKF